MADLSTPPAAARVAPIEAGALVAVGLAAPCSRFSFRGASAAAAACGAAFACTLGEDVCRATEQGGRAALWLGPDEWLLLSPEAGTASLFEAIETALGPLPHALVDISHRQVGFDIAGSGRDCRVEQRLPARSVARGLSGRHVDANRAGEIRYRALAPRSWTLPVGGQSLLRRLRRGLLADGGTRRLTLLPSPLWRGVGVRVDDRGPRSFVTKRVRHADVRDRG